MLGFEWLPVIDPATRLFRWITKIRPPRPLTIQRVAEFNHLYLCRRWALLIHNPAKVPVIDAVVTLDDLWLESRDTEMTLDRWEMALPMSWRGAADPVRTSIASDAVMHVDLLLQQRKSSGRVLEIGYADLDVRSRETLSGDEPFFMQLSLTSAERPTQFAVLRVDPPVATNPILAGLEPTRAPIQLVWTGNERAKREEFTK